MGQTITVTEEHDVANPNSLTFEERQADLEAFDEAEKKAKEREKNAPYKRWAQINLDVRDKVRSLMKENPNAYIIWDWMVDKMGPYNSLLCSYTVMQEALNMSRSTVSRAIKLLKERGFIVIKKSAASNVYLLNDNVVWKSWGKNIKFCEFPSNVILSASEQTEKETKKVTRNAPQIALKEEPNEELEEALDASEEFEEALNDESEAFEEALKEESEEA